MNPAKPSKYTINYSKRDLLNAQKTQYLLKWVHENHPEVVRKCDDMIEKLLKFKENDKK